MPPEAIARALELRDRLAAAHKLWDKEFQALVRQARPAGAVMRTSKKHFDAFSAGWKKLPTGGSLRRVVKRDPDGGLQAIELRVIPSRIRLHSWEVGGEELALEIIIVTAIAGPKRYEEARAVLATLGLHAVGRYFERAGDCSIDTLSAALRILIDNYDDVISRARDELDERMDELAASGELDGLLDGLLNDLLANEALAANKELAARLDEIGLGRVGQFRLSTAAGGLWAGAVKTTQADQQPVMAVRTFTPKETGGFRFAEVVKLKRAGERC